MSPSQFQFCKQTKIFEKLQKGEKAEKEKKFVKSVKMSLVSLRTSVISQKNLLTPIFVSLFSCFPKEDQFKTNPNYRMEFYCNREMHGVMSIYLTQGASKGQTDIGIQDIRKCDLLKK